MAKMSGKSGKIQVGGVDVHVSQWDVDPKSALIDTTDSGDGDWEGRRDGVSHLTGNCQAFFDPAAQPMSNPPNIKFGVLLSLKLFYGNSGAFLGPFNAYVSGIPITNSVKGAITYSFSFESDGAVPGFR